MLFTPDDLERMTPEEIEDKIKAQSASLDNIEEQDEEDEDEDVDGVLEDEEEDFQIKLTDIDGKVYFDRKAGK